MSVFKKASGSKSKFQRGGYDTQLVREWENTNKESLTIINSYNERINKSEWLDKEDRAAYRKALDTYIETANSLRGINKTFGEGYTDEDEKNWNDSITSMNEAYDSTEKYYSQWLDEKDYKGQRNGWFQKSNLFDDGYQFGDVTKTVVGSVTDLGKNLGAGLLGIGEAAVDAFAMLGQAQQNQILGESMQSAMGLAALTGKDVNEVVNTYTAMQNTSKEATAEFVKKDLYDEGAIAKTIIANPVKALTGIDAETDSVFGEKSDSLAQSAGQLGGTVALQAVGVPWWLTTGVTTFGSESQNAFNQGATYEEAALSGIISAGAEIISENLTGGISFGSKTFGDLLPKLTAKISNKAVRTLLDLGIDMVGEGGEEIFSGFMSAIGQKLTYASDKEISELFSSDDALDSFIGGVVLGGFGNVSGNVRQKIYANKQASKIYGNQSQQLVDEALGSQFSDVKVVGQKYKDKLDSGKKLSGGNLNKLIDVTDTSKLKSSVLKRLGDLGETSDVTAVADVLVKQAMGEELTSKDWGILNDSKAGHIALAEMNKDNIQSGGLANKWAESIGTRRINPDLYSRGVAKGTPQNQASKANIEASKVTIQKDGETVEVKPTKITSIENDTVSIELDNGEVVNSDEVDFGDSGIGLVYEAAKDMASRVGGFNIDTANVFVRGYDPKGNITAGEYVHGWSAAFKFGTMNSPLSVLESNASTLKLTDKQRKDAYNFGKAFGKEPVATSQKSEGFEGEYTKRSYNSEQAELLSALPVEALQNAADSNGALSFNAIGLGGDKSAQQKWVDAGLTYTEDGRVYVDENAVLDERDRRRNALKETKKAENVSETQKSTKKNGRVIFDGERYGKRLNERQRASLKALNFIAKALGIDIYVDKLAKGDNGWYDPKDRSIHIDLYAGVEAEALMLFAAAHELTHDIRATLPEKFNLLADAVFEEYTKRYSDHVMEDLIEAKIEFLKEKGDITEDMTEEEAYDHAYEEVICDCCETLLADSNAIEALSQNIYAKDKTLWKKIKDFFARLVARIKAAYADVIPDTEEGQRFRDLGKGAERIKNLWVEAIVELSEVDKTTGEGKVKHSYSSIAYSFFGDKKVSIKDLENGSYKDTDGYKRYVDQCLDNMRQSVEGFSEKSALKEITDSIDGIVEIAVAMKKAGYDILDSEGGRNIRDSKKRLLFSSLEPNSDYFTSSDISTICDKRINFAEIYDEIVRREDAMGVPKNKRFFNNIDNYFVLHKILAEKGLTAPCRQCYVESMRKNLDPMANAFIELMQETDPNNKDNKQLYQPSGKNKGELKSNNAKLRENLLEVIEREQYDITADKLTIKMLTTADGLAQLKLQAPLIYEAFNSFYGQSKPKMPKAATPFRFGELTALLTDDKGKIKTGLIKQIMSTGGFRLQSYSDFQIQNFADVLQVIFEAGTLGLNGHAYTKVPAFLDATKGTNLKRNISIFMYKDGGQWKIDRGDSFPYELEDIYDIVDADESGNTGIIAVVQNEDMAAWIMANNNIGYFIPFHKSGVKMGVVRDTIVREGGREIKGYSGIKDHTRQQTEVWAKTTADHKANTKVKKGINIYEFWDFDNVKNLSQKELIEKNVMAYIDACNEAGYLPKFREYVMDNGKVLNKVLSYAKELGFVSQNATIDDISFEYSGYRIPYGYYKCLGDFGMFTPDGEASPIERLSLKDYNFKDAVKFFSDAETLRRNEILQQFENGTEREKYRSGEYSYMTTAELSEEVQNRRNQVVDEVVSGEYKKKKYSHTASQKSDFSNNEMNNVHFSNGVTQEIIDNYVEAAYSNQNEEDYKKYAEPTGRLIADVSNEINIIGYSHALRDNDIRHIRNSHGEATPEKYPVTKEDIKNIPWLVENYDKVFVIKRPDGRTGIVYVKASRDGLVYYLEQVTQNYGNEPLLVNKQMIKTGADDIPDIKGLRDAITKKQSEAEFLNDLKKVPQVYVQNVRQPHSKESIPHSPNFVNREMADRDTSYIDAVNRGDMETAQKMVDEAAKKAGAMVLNNGAIKHYYHGTDAAFTTFDAEKARDGTYGFGFYFSPMKSKASQYGELKDVYLMTERIATRLSHNITAEQVSDFVGRYNIDLNDSILKYADSIEDWVGYKDDMSIMLDLERFVVRSMEVDIKKLLYDLIEVFGYDGVRQTNETVLWDNRLIKSADPVTYDDNGKVIPLSERFNTKNSDIRYSHKADKKASYAPTFYSHMGKVIDGIKLDKMGAGGVVPYLKGKGVKNEEIKWSGIEVFLEGKKSVTKAELQEFVAGSQLQIEEESSDPIPTIDIRKSESSDYAYALYDEDGNILDQYSYDYAGELVSEETGESYMDVEAIKRELTEDSDNTRWSQYKLDGGSNYRELAFKLPGSTYSNRAMRGHWGGDAEGILVHARIQDFTVDGKKMLFIEELQSDWHNEGHEKGYTTKEYEDAVAVYDKLAEDYDKKRRAFNQYVRSSEFRSDPDEVSKKKFDWLRSKMETAEKRMQAAERDMDALKEKGMGDVPDAPFRENYHEYVLKRLIRMAAEEGYDSIGWTIADTQSKRWSYDYEKAYQIEYDQEMPKFLRKYGKKWGATVGYSYIRNTSLDRNRYEEQIADMESQIEQYRDELEDDNTEDYNIFIQEGISDLQNTLSNLYNELRGEKIWSMDITDSMKDSVLYEGQPKYSHKADKKASYSGGDTSNLIGKEVMFYEEGDRKPDLTLVEVVNERTGKTETTVKFIGDKPKDYIPQKVAYCYKLFEQHPDGTLHALFAGASDATPIGEWQYAKGFPYTDSGVQGMNLRERYGWHLSAGLPSAPHLMSSKYFERGYPSKNAFGHIKGSKRVWVRMVYDASTDFNSLADSTKEGDIFGLIPFGGYYAFKENNHSEWVISSGVKIDKILTEDERQQILKDAGYDEYEAWRKKHRPTEAEKAESKRQSAENKKAKDKAKKEGRNYLSESAKEMRETIKSRIIVNPELSDIKYQHRTTNGMKPRILLANALETAAQNDIEREKLKQYKQKIDLLNSEEQKLHELEEKISELYRKKGPRDTEAIKRLRFEATQAANRINTYDKQLLNLESTKALKGVLEREKEMLRKRLEQKATQSRREALEKARERAAKTERELMNRYQESRKKATESRNKTAMRHKIKGIVSELNTLLLKPTAKKHIKEELRKEVADALLAINMDTVGADERVAMYNDLIAKEKNPDIIAELTKTRDNIQLQGDNLKEKLNNLQSAYEKIKNTDDIELNLAYQEVIQNSIKAVSEKVGKTSIRNMTLEQLEMVYDLFKMIRHTIRDANKAFKEQKGQTIMQMAEAVNDQVRTVGGQPYKRNALSAILQRIGWTFLKPYVAFRTIGSVTLTNMYKELRNGEDTFYTDVKEAQAFIEDQYKKHGYKSWDMKKTKTFTAKSGKTFDLTLEQMMSLYAYYQREQAHDHIIEGGIVFEDSLVTEKNKWGIPIKYEVTTKDAFNLSEDTFKGICDYLEENHKDVVAYVKEMQAYLSDTMGAKGNEVSMELLGVKLFKEKFYLPIKSSQYYMNFKAEEAGEVKLKSPAFSKETVKHANNPIVIHNFTDLWAEHINDMSMYHAFVLALEDFTRVYNYKTKTDAKVETMDTKATLETAYPGVTQYINKFLKDMNGGVRAETVGWAEKLTSLSKKGAVLGSASVTIQQPSAVMRAMAYINPKYFVATAHKSINLAKHKQDFEELKKYAPIAGIKEMGRFDVGMGQETVDWIKSNKTVMDKAEDIISLPPAFMDEVTWVSIWNAVKREAAHNNPTLNTSSEGFLKLAGERFTEIIALSQVYDSVFSRSDLMRNKSWIAKSLTAFMAEPTTVLNMLWDSWVQAKRSGSVKGYAKATTVTGGAVVAATVLNAALKSIIMAMRDDDEDESYVEKYLEAFVGDLKDSLNPLSLIPFVKDIVSIFNGYDVERMDMAMFSDLKKALDAMDSDSKTLYEKWSGLIGAISAFVGVPFKNVERDIRGLITTVFGKTEETTVAGMLNAIKEGWTGKENSKGQQLYEAMIKGDSAQIERVESRFEDQNDIDAAIRKALRENDSRIKKAAEAYLNRDYATYNKLRDEIVAEGVFSWAIVTDALKAEYNYLKKKAEEAE